MPKSLSKLLKIILPLGLGFFLIYYSFHSTTEEQRVLIWSYVQQAHPLPIFISILFGVLSHLSRAYRWRFLLAPLGYKPRFINLTCSVLIAYLSNLGVPRSGEILRVSVLSAYEKIPFPKGFGTVISERIIDLLMLLILIFTGFLLGGDWVESQLDSSTALLTTFVIVLGVVTFLIVSPFFVNTQKFPFLARLKSFFKELYQGIISIRSLPNAFAFWTHTLFIWVMYILMFWVVKFALPGAEHLGFEAILLAFIAGGLSITMTNGGIGLYPLAVAAVFSHYELSYELALAYGWITWTIQTIMILLFGGLSFAILPIVNRKK